MDFSTVGEEIAYYLAHIARPFMGGWSGSGENGIDVSMPTGTPVYAVQGGTVVGAGYYQGGGVVSIKSAPGRVWYYQHLDSNSLAPGQQVPAGELVGYSGGQNSGGQHPASPEFSSFEHIEVGINAPWGGIWGGGPSVGPNVNPVPALTQQGLAARNVPTGANSSTTTGSGTATATLGGSFNPIDPSTWAPSILGGIFAPLGITTLQDLLWRTGLIGAGLILVFIGLGMLILPEAERAAPLAAAAA